MVKRGVYIAVTSDCNVYGGQTMDLSRRTNQHKHSDKTIIARYEMPPVEISMAERRLIKFLKAQSQEEDFVCVNKNLKRR